MTQQRYPNHFRRQHFAYDLNNHAAEFEHEKISVAGRIMRVNDMGKSIFADLQDMSGTIQLLVRVANSTVSGGVSEHAFAKFKQCRRGDIIGVKGVLMKTKIGVISVRVNEISLLVKVRRVLPEKFHGLRDIEQRYRKRHLDLITNKAVRTVFNKRSEMIAYTRRYFNDHGFCEVETPMMHPLAGGARAKPFQTYHNALAMDLYLRVAPELYLKRLIVGGIEKVYEINRSFRNEGISAQHNPEFTMLEFYEAYNDYVGLMSFIETFLREIAGKFYNSKSSAICFSAPFQKMRMVDAVVKHCDDLRGEDLEDQIVLADYIKNKLGMTVQAQDDAGKLLVEIFEKTVEKQLKRPTFITHYPVSVSPLARCNDENPNYVDRFELFVDGKEIANGFSELNDPEEQKKRFEQQIQEKAAGDEEAMDYDEDYIAALEYGMPPTAGAGIGIDRMVMLITGAESIRDVILFPQMKQKD